MEKLHAKSIDQIELEFEPPIEREASRLSPAAIALELGSICMKFARVERVPRYDDYERESDVEHSFMLSMVATELAHLYYPELDKQLVGEYGRVHDLIEVATGDIATFNLTADELAAKEAAEHAALDALLDQLPPYTASLLASYELQADLEARFVRAVDKLMPVVVDIIGQGSHVMHEDYGVTELADLKSSHESLHARIAQKFGEFATIIRAHRQLCDLFEKEFTVT